MTELDGQNAMLDDETCPNWDDHEWGEGYFGYSCRKCGMFYAFGCAPWEDLE